MNLSTLIGRRCVAFDHSGQILAIHSGKRLLIRFDDGGTVSTRLIREYVTLLSGHSTQPVMTTAQSVTRLCPVCGEDISHLRPQARTCSAKCRKQLSRMIV